MAARSWPPRALVRGSSTTGCNGHSEGADSKDGERSVVGEPSFVPAFRGVSREVPIPARNPAGGCQGHARTIADGSPGRSACRAARSAGDDARHARPAVLLASALSTNCRAEAVLAIAVLMVEATRSLVLLAQVRLGALAVQLLWLDAFALLVTYVSLTRRRAEAAKRATLALGRDPS